MNRKHRLTSSREFRRVVRTGARAQHAGLLCFAAPGQAGGPVRVGVTATRGVGGAVQRNRAKRLLRECARGSLTCIPEGTEVVLMAKSPWDGKTFQEIRAALDVVLTKTGARC